LYDKAQTYYDNRDDANAVIYFKKATEADPSYGEAWYKLGWCYNDQETYTLASEALKKAKVLMPTAQKFF